MGCNEVQGFYYYRPIPINEFYKLLRMKNRFPSEIREKNPAPLFLIKDKASPSNHRTDDFVPGSVLATETSGLTKVS